MVMVMLNSMLDNWIMTRISHCAPVNSMNANRLGLTDVVVLVMRQPQTDLANGANDLAPRSY